ncbi:hypothetical protein GTP23_16625 [Pseudoduganella sp. FT93W]|uniref:Uncharacterized protein n=1 Tax=Duganella fentianensis TaxID=2692177 RepID=A0A845HZ82_9BURK|nr:hypothetical protein [Duganella fentianensis]MYN46674.1 hypothetical protein [Duganella fentianensis]
MAIDNKQQSMILGSVAKAAAACSEQLQQYFVFGNIAIAFTQHRAVAIKKARKEHTLVAGGGQLGEISSG